MNLKDTKNILVIRFSSLGDLVTLEFTFRAIRFFFPEYNIIFLTSPIGVELYKDSTYFNEYFLYENLLKTTFKLRKKTFDIVINLQNNKPSLIIAASLQKRLLINKSYSLMDKLFFRKPLVKSTQNLLELCVDNKEKINHYFQIKANTIINLPTNRYVEITSLKKIIALSTGSSERWESKRWGVENYIQLISKLLNKNFEIILIGSKLELKDEKKILQNFPTIKSFVHKTTISELKDILKQVDLYIGNDSGPTLIAAGVGTSTLTIFGSTDIKHRPVKEFYNGTHLYVKPSATIKCHPCYKTKCPTHHECMQNIKPEVVYQTALNYFEWRKNE